MPKLLVISSVSASFVDGNPHLDIKFVEGMRYYCDLWDGEVSCAVGVSDTPTPFGKPYVEQDLPFKLNYLKENAPIGMHDVQGFDLVLCSGDNANYLHVSNLCKRLGVSIIYIIEYILETRLQITVLERNRSFIRKMYSALHALMTEFKRRQAFKIASGLQANGFPAKNAYEKINRNTLLYLDNRIRSSMLATESELSEKFSELKSGGPLRLMHSGRLETMKGSHDILPICKILKSRGINFELHIFGAGSLENEIAEGIKKENLERQIVLHGVVDFESELVPFARKNIHVYLSCHRQSDPSCSYLENMGCGLSIAGYSNRMWKALCEVSSAGCIAPLGNTTALADCLTKLAHDADKAILLSQKAHSFAAQHSFESVFEQRVNHLKQTIQPPEVTYA